MEELFLFAWIIFQCFYMKRLLTYKARVKALEDRLHRIESRVFEKARPEQPLKTAPPPAPIPSSPQAVSTASLPTDEGILDLIKDRIGRFQIPSFIKDNWLAMIGSMACVIGVVFFGITSGLLERPEIRIAAMLIFALLLLAASTQLKASAYWYSSCNALKSTAAAIILFAALGAGGIKGLQCIDSPILAFAILCLGIATNIYLSMTSPSQLAASLHVLMSLLALCVAPQTVLFLPLGTAIVVLGLYNARKSNWDFHLIFILIAFAIQNTIWTHFLELTPWMHDLAIACSLAVGILAGTIHYQKRYKSTDLEWLPLVAHITNWMLLAWNLYTHAQFSNWTSLILALASIAGFILSRKAKKREILWLYYTDTILSQVLALASITALYSFAVQPQDICILALLGTATLNLVYQFQQEKFLIRVGHFTQIGICLIFLALSVPTLFDSSQTAHHFPLYARMGIATAICWGFYIYTRSKNLIQDSLNHLFKISGPSFSITALFGTVYFLLAYVSGSESMLIQCLGLIVMAGLSLCWIAKEDATANSSLLVSLLCFHIHHWYLLVFSHSFGFRADFLGLILLDSILIFWGKSIQDFIIYALAIQIGLMTCLYSGSISSVIFPIAYLGYSLLALEIARALLPTKAKLQKGFVYAGLAFLFSFIAVLPFEINPAPLHQISEILGSLTILYWIARKPQIPQYPVIQILTHRLIEVFLGFISLSIIREIPDTEMPTVWAFLAFGLLAGTTYFRWPNRLYTYAWAYLIISLLHTTFIASTLTFHPALLSAICLQLLFAHFSHDQRLTNQPKNALSHFLFKQPFISVLFPIFIEIALLFAFNYEKTLLTLFWVGLSCVYLSLSLLAKSKWGMQIAMGSLVVCSMRLVIFDLTQSDLATRALVFLGVGIFMLCISIVYKKYKYRTEST
jgi:hypothetical protein